MASSKFKRRQRAKQQRIEGNSGFVPISVAVEYARQRQEEEEQKKMDTERRVEAASECGDLEFLRIDIDSALCNKEWNNIPKYKKGAEDKLKGKAPYLGTSRASFFRKRLPTLEQNGGSSLEMFGFTVKKAVDTPKKRTREEMQEEEDAVISQAEKLEGQLAADLNATDLEDIEDESAVVDYEEEEELEDVSATAKYAEDIEEMKALIPVLEGKYNNLMVSDDDQQQTHRAYFDLKKYNTFRYASLIAYFKKRCFDKKKKVL